LASICLRTRRRARHIQPYDMGVSCQQAAENRGRALADPGMSTEAA